MLRTPYSEKLCDGPIVSEARLFGALIAPEPTVVGWNEACPVNQPEAMLTGSAPAKALGAKIQRALRGLIVIFQRGMKILKVSLTGVPAVLFF